LTTTFQAEPLSGPAASVTANGRGGDTRSSARALQLAGVVVVIGLLAAIYLTTFMKLAAYWSTNDTYSYGFMVPFISAVLVWLKRDELSAIAIRGGLLPGTLVSAIGLLALMAGRLSGTNLLEELSFVVTVAGLTWLLLGHTFLYALAFPIAYLLAMIPVWDFLTSRLHPYFQLYSANVGVGVLRLAGIPVFLDGVLISLPNITLVVAEACSGINYLISVLCIGVPLTMLFIRRWPKRLMVVMGAALIALLSNGLRVAMVSVFAYYEIRGADGDVHGPFAIFRSLLISGIGFVALFALIGRFADDHGALDRRPAATIIAIALLTGAVVFEQTHQVAAIPLHGPLSTFPDRIGEWQAKVAATFASELSVAPFDDAVSKNYFDNRGNELNLFIGYYGSQREGRELAGQSLRTILTGRDHASYTRTQPDAHDVSDFFLDAPRGTIHLTYWYGVAGRWVSHHYQEKLLNGFNTVVNRNSSGMVVIVKAAAKPTDSPDQARSRVRDFLDGVDLALAPWTP
jgi:EpsI family protein